MLTVEAVMTALEKVVDPELGVDIVNLGLVYDVEVFADTGAVLVAMTLTTPGCPLSQSMPAAVDRALWSVEGVRSAKVELVWSPPWTPAMMTPAGRAKLGVR
jgi:metal-sulfur cluster biosynthetic enzyme